MGCEGFVPDRCSVWGRCAPLALQVCHGCTPDVSLQQKAQHAHDRPGGSGFFWWLCSRMAASQAATHLPRGKQMGFEAGAAARARHAACMVGSHADLNIDAWCGVAVTGAGVGGGQGTPGFVVEVLTDTRCRSCVLGGCWFFCQCLGTVAAVQASSKPTGRLWRITACLLCWCFVTAFSTAGASVSAACVCLASLHSAWYHSTLGVFFCSSCCSVYELASAFC